MRGEKKKKTEEMRSMRKSRKPKCEEVPEIENKGKKLKARETGGKKNGKQVVRRGARTGMEKE